MISAVESTSPVRVVLAAASVTWLYRVLNAVSGLITLPLLVAALGKSGFGVWVLVGQAISFFSLSDLGVSNAVGRLIARARGTGDRAAYERVLSTVMAVTLLEGLIVACATVLAAPFVPGFLGLGQQYSADAVIVFRLLGLSLAIQLPLRIAMGVLAGHQQYGAHATAKIFEAVLSPTVLFVLAALGRLDLVSCAWASALIAVTSQAVLVAVAWRWTGPWHLSVSRVSITTAKEALDMGAAALSITLSTLLFTQGLGLAVGRSLGVEAAGIFGVALSLAANLQPMLAAFGSPFATLASEWQARGELERLNDVLVRAMQATFALSASAAAGVLVYGEPILRVLIPAASWSEPDFRQAATALSVMMGALAVGLPYMTTRSVLQGVGRHWAATAGLFLASLGGLVAGFWTMHAGWGIVGAACGWGLGQALQGGVVYPLIAQRHIGERFVTTATRVYLPGSAVAVAVLGLAAACSRLVVPDTAAGVLAGIVVCAAAGGMGTFLVATRARPPQESLSGC